MQKQNTVADTAAVYTPDQVEYMIGNVLRACIQRAAVLVSDPHEFTGLAAEFAEYAENSPAYWMQTRPAPPTAGEE